MRLSLCFFMVAVILTGCGSFEDGAPTGSHKDADSTELQTSGDLRAFCDQTESLDGLTRPPKDDELDRLLDTAPEEIRDDVEILVQSAKDFRQDRDTLPSDRAQAAGKNLDAYVQENCEDD